MGTGIFHDTPFGRQELTQHDIDMWCRRCQFPYGKGRCTDKELIEICWAQGVNAHDWHLRHACPFAHKAEKCRCAEFKGIEAAFEAAGLPYSKSGQLEEEEGGNNGSKMH